MSKSNLSVRRTELNKSQKEIASEMGIKQGLYSRYETGTADIPESRFDDLKRALHISDEDEASFFNIKNLTKRKISAKPV